MYPTISSLMDITYCRSLICLRMCVSAVKSLFVVGVRILGHFARAPFHYCSRLPNVKIPQQLAAGKLKGAWTAQI